MGSNRLHRALFAVVAAVLLVVSVTQSAGAATVNDPAFSRQWWLRRIHAPEAWKTTTGKGITIAVVDTGVDPRHPDLKGHMVPGWDAIKGAPSNTDPHGHGTGVAGMAAAIRNNRTGIAGVAPDAKIMPIRGCSISGENTCEGGAVAEGIMWAVDHGADVINLSLGANIPVIPDWDLAVTYAAAQGVLVVAAAGNSTTPMCGSPAFNPLVLCVGASDALDTMANFSSYGLRLDGGLTALSPHRESDRM